MFAVPLADITSLKLLKEAGIIGLVIIDKHHLLRDMLPISVARRVQEGGFLPSPVKTFDSLPAPKQGCLNANGSNAQ